ncbi:MAG: TonB-dependent receptor [Prevotella sp.]|jgi:TonB-linked SusC/RagA family outer membrane protein|nr:TonB-dependent receptor [Prevotella sp.]
MKKKLVGTTIPELLAKNKHFFRIMKLTLVFLVFCISCCFATTMNSQTARVNINASNQQIKVIIDQIESQTDYLFVYNNDNVDLSSHITMKTENTSVANILSKIFENTDIVYAMEGNNILLMKKEKLQITQLTKTIQGIVRDQNNEAIIGASVVEVGTTNGTMTDIEGKFTLSVSSEASTIKITYVGYIDQQIKIGDKTDFSIVMQENTQLLEEVVVVGYGIEKKSVVTGSISKITSSDIENMPVMRLEQSLQGRTSGVSVISSSGMPGADATVRVRGVTSINNSDPLYVVNGQVIPIGDINFLNQSDIASIEVLKDAASAAIYGTKAASGVILVTTKSGKEGKMRLSYNGYFGLQAPDKKLDLLNATQYATLRNESSQAAGKGLVFDNVESLGKGTDWQDVIFSNSAKIQNHEFSLSGGNQISTYYSSFSYFDQEGIVTPDAARYKRLTFRLNTTHKIKPWLRLGANATYSYVKNSNNISANTERGGVLNSAINLDPITPVIITDPQEMESNPYASQPVMRDKNGYPYGISKYVANEITNPLAYIKTKDGNYAWTHNIISNAYLEIEPLKDLKVRSQIAAKMTFWGDESFTPLYYLNAVQTNLEKTIYDRSLKKTLLWSLENTASYSKAIGDHFVSGMVGNSIQDRSADGLSGKFRGIPADNFDDASLNYSLSNENKIATGFEDQPYRISSFFGRASYNYKEKYLFTGIIRIDGSSRFGENNRYGTFPSVQAGWVPSRESFWKSDIINTLKLRLSYGVTGNDNFGAFSYVSTISSGRNYIFGTDNNIHIGYSPNGLANPDLKWEKTSQTNIGVDMRILENFDLSVDVYKKQTRDMLLAVSYPKYVGISGSSYGNIADMDNKGFEIELGYHKQLGNVFLDVKGNISHVKNEVIYLGDDKDYLEGDTFQASDYNITRTAVGQPIASFYGFKTMGIFQTQEEVDNYKNKDGKVIQPNAKPGDFRFADLDGDGQISGGDRDFLGSSIPTWYYGLTVNLTYKDFDLSIFGQGSGGNKIFQGLRRLDIPTANYSTAALDRWTGPGTSNSYPRLTDSDTNRNFTKPSDFYLESGAFFRIKTIQLGYNIPTRITQKLDINRLRVYMTVNNLATFTKYTGYDPEMAKSIDRGIYPQARSYMFGLNLSF